MKTKDLLQLVSFLGRLSQRPWSGSDTHLLEQHNLNIQGTSSTYDLYRAKIPEQEKGILVAIHGVTVHGGQDQRLVHFARCLARSGVTCAVPTLAGLAGIHWHASDIDHLTQLILELAQGSQRRIGLIGFSYGASYALVAATRPTVRDQVRFVLSLGACHSFVDLWTWYRETQGKEPTSEAEWDYLIYQHLILAKQNPDLIPRRTEVILQVESLLRRFCYEATLLEKKEFYQHHLAGLGLIEVAFHRQTPTELLAMSPAGKLDAILCPVSILHDLHDPMVPPIHAERIYAELGGLLGADQSKLLITPLLSHISVVDLWRVGQMKQFLEVLAPLFTGG